MTATFIFTYTTHLLWVSCDSAPHTFLISGSGLKKPCLFGTSHFCGNMENINDGTVQCSSNFCSEVTFITTAHISLAKLRQTAKPGVNGWEVYSSVRTNNLPP